MQESGGAHRRQARKSRSSRPANKAGARPGQSTAAEYPGRRRPNSLRCGRCTGDDHLGRKPRAAKRVARNAPPFWERTLRTTNRISVRAPQRAPPALPPLIETGTQNGTIGCWWPFELASALSLLPGACGDRGLYRFEAPADRLGILGRNILRAGEAAGLGTIGIRLRVEAPLHLGYGLTGPAFE